VLFACWPVAARAQAKTFTFANTFPINIPDKGVGDPWPSSLVVSGVTGPISKVTVTLDGFTHASPNHMDMLLEGPAPFGQFGRRVALMFGAGRQAVSDLTLTFDDDAAQRVPNGDPLVSGTYKPFNWQMGDQLFAPAPPRPYSTQLSAFNGMDPNGKWNLWVQDMIPAGEGKISGWSLTVTTGLGATAAPEPASVSLLAVAGVLAAGRLHRRQHRRSLKNRRSSPR
jgi:hypothetical protein